MINSVINLFPYICTKIETISDLSHVQIIIRIWEIGFIMESIHSSIGQKEYCLAGVSEILRMGREQGEDPHRDL